MTSNDPVDHLEKLGVLRYLDFSSDTSRVPQGIQKPIMIRRVDPLPLTEIQAAAASAPGSVWYVLGEPNAWGLSVADTVVALHDTYQAILSEDPTAQITSPSILNWDFTCINCGGYQSGHSWLAEFLDEYQLLYGEAPPISIWAIDVYPIIWDAAQFPTVRADIVIEQITDFRAFLETLPYAQSDPIWITEIGLHWGFDDWVFEQEGCVGPAPAGEYQPQLIKDYLREVFSWLEANSASMSLDTWFLYSTYADIDVCNSASANGLTLFDSAGSDGQLTEVGWFYRDWVHNVR